MYRVLVDKKEGFFETVRQGTYIKVSRTIPIDPFQANYRVYTIISYYCLRILSAWLVFDCPLIIV